MQFDTTDHLESFFLLSPVGFAVVDEKFRFLWVNNAFAEMNAQQISAHEGKSVEEILGKTVWQTLKPFYQKAYKGETFRDISISSKVLKKTQKSRHFLVTLYPLKEKNTISKVGCLIQDVTEQKRSEEDLHSIKDRLEFAQESAAIGSFEWDFQTGNIWWSPEEAKLLGYPEETSQSHISELEKIIHPDDVDQVMNQMNTIKKNLSYFESEFRIIRPDKAIRWIKGKAKVYRNTKNEIVKIIGVNYDITNRKRNEEILQFKAEMSQILSRSLDYDTIVNSLSKIAVKYVADWCAIDILSPQNTLELVAVAHKDPKKVKWAKKLRVEFPPDLTEPHGVAQVIRTGIPEFYPEITKEVILAAAKSQRELDIIEKVGFTSVIIVPLIIKGKPIGAISLITAESKRRYDNSDFEMAKELSYHASFAIENVTLYNEVKREQGRLENLLKNVPGVVWEAYGVPDHSEQEINFVSEYVEHMLGYTVNEWLSTPNFWLHIVHPDDRKRAGDESVAIFNSGERGVSRFRWIKKDGKALWIESHSYVITNSNGEPIGMRGVSMDISDRVEIERRKDEFISIASHELKTPVTSIKVFTQVLQSMYEKGKYDQTGKYLQKMDNQIQKLTNLIADLLNVSKIQAGKIEFRKDWFDLTHLIKDTVETLQAITGQKIKFQQKESLKVWGDEDRIGQVLVNLISNAIKYSPDESTVVISTEKNGSQTIVHIQDFGMGIASEHQDKIFDRFYRVFDATDRTFPGLGMGLYISYYIISHHDGKIWVKSEVGEGSVFSFSLPNSPDKTSKMRKRMKRIT